MNNQLVKVGTSTPVHLPSKTVILIEWATIVKELARNRPSRALETMASHEYIYRALGKDTRPGERTKGSVAKTVLMNAAKRFAQERAPEYPVGTYAVTIPGELGPDLWDALEKALKASILDWHWVIEDNHLLDWARNK